MMQKIYRATPSEEALREEFDALLRRVQQPGSAEKMRRRMHNATPEDMAKARDRSMALEREKYVEARPRPQHSLDERVAQYDLTVPLTAEDKHWLNDPAEGKIKLRTKIQRHDNCETDLPPQDKRRPPD